MRGRSRIGVGVAEGRGRQNGDHRRSGRGPGEVKVDEGGFKQDQRGKGREG